MSNGRLDPIHDAVLSIADEGSIRGKLDFTTGEGTGLLTFTVDGVAYTLDLYRSEDAEEARPVAEHIEGLVEERANRP